MQYEEIIVNINKNGGINLEEKCCHVVNGDVYVRENKDDQFIYIGNHTFDCVIDGHREV